MNNYRIGAFPSVKLFKKDKITNKIDNLTFEIGNDENMLEWLYNEVRNPAMLLQSD